ncbi:unnamed protein product [Durusdinium trenchii]|uniref:Uncharacterized protein n=1 Tax=Durusdinium trenchii TaxID=1381693 RepID=A0ABP0M9R4_9DINO
MSSWYVVLIANDGDLKNAVGDAKLVEKALLNCGLCKKEQLWPIYDQPGDVIKETLEHVGNQVPKGGYLFVWYSGHALGHDVEGAGGFKGTLIVPKVEEADSLDENNEVVDKASCVWLEDTLFGIFARHELRLWAVVAACRGSKAEFERGRKKDGHHGKIVLEEPEYANNLQLVSDQKRTRFAFLYSMPFGQNMWDNSIFAKCFCYNLERLGRPQDLEALQKLVKDDSELLSFGEVSPPEIVGEPRSIRIKIEQEQTQAQMLDYTPDMLGAVSALKLVAIYLHQLADGEIYDDASYEDVRLLAWDIIQSLNECAPDFGRLKDQIWLLSCRSLEEVKDVLVNHQAASPSTGGYPSRPSDWKPNDEDRSDEEYELNQDPGVVLNLPDDVVAAISNALSMAQSKEERDHFPFDTVLDMLQMLGGYFTIKKLKQDKLEDISEQTQQKYFFKSSGAIAPTLEDAEEMDEMLREQCEKICMVPEDLDVIREQIRTYVGKSSFWVIVVSPKPLKAQSLLQILEDFVRRRKGSCFGWLSADAPREVPHFAAPGFEKLIDLVEGLGGAVEVPSLVPLKGSFFKDLAMQLMKKQGEATEGWQLRVVSNYRDVGEDQWLNSQQNVDFHVVRCFNWVTAHWKKPELLEHLLRFAAAESTGPEGLRATESVEELVRPRSQVLCTLGCLLHAIQDDPTRLALSIDTIIQVLCSTAEPEDVLKKLVLEVYRLGRSRSPDSTPPVPAPAPARGTGRWCWSHSSFAVLGQRVGMNPLRWSVRMTVKELAEDLGNYLLMEPRGVTILFEETEESYRDQLEAVGKLQDLIRKESNSALSAASLPTLQALESLLCKGAVPHLMKALQDGDHDVRSCAGKALGQMGSAALEALPELLNALVKEQAYHGGDGRSYASEALGKMGFAAAEPVLKLLKVDESERESRKRKGDDGFTRVVFGGDWPVRVRVADALGHMGRAQVELLPPLLEALQETEYDDLAFSRLVEVVRKIEFFEHEIVPKLLNLLDDAKFHVYESARDALSAMGPAAFEAVPRLLEKMHNNNPHDQLAAEELKLYCSFLLHPTGSFFGPMRSYLQRILGLHQPDRAAKILKVFEHHELDVFVNTAAVLSKLGPLPAQVVPRLLQSLKETDSEVRRNAAIALEATEPTDEIVQALLKALEDGNTGVRSNAVKTLGKMGPAAAEAVPKLLQALHDNDSAVRCSAAKALANMNDVASEAVPDLLQALEDGDREVRRSAAESLGKMDLAVEALPQLLKALENEEDEVRSSVARALGNMRSAAAEAVPHVVKTLRDEACPVRCAAAEALGNMCSAEAVPELLKVLEEAITSESTSMQRSTIYALDRLNALPALPSQPLAKLLATKTSFRGFRSEDVPWLVKALEHRGTTLRKDAAEAFGSIKPATSKAVPHLCKALGDPEGDVRCSAAKSLGEMGPVAAEAAPKLLEALHDYRVDVFSAALGALRQIGSLPSRAVPMLLEALDARHPAVRSGAVQALVQMGPAEGIPQLLQALDDEDFNVRQAAAEALSQMSSSTQLQEALQKPETFVQRRAADELAGLGGPVVSHLLKALEDEQNAVRRGAAAELLGKMGAAAAEVVPKLLKALEDPDVGVRSRAATALGQIGPAAAEAVPHLLEVLRDTDRLVRSHAAWALGQIGPAAAEAVPALLRTLPEDPDLVVRCNVARALGQIGPAAAEAVPQLLKALEGSDADIELCRLRSSAAEALGQMGPAAAQAVPQLIKSLADEAGILRATAAQALGNIGSCLEKR